jgi:acyl dehydratase
VERATRELGGTIAHGNMTLSLISQLSKDILRLSDMKRGLNYGWDKVRFMNPVQVGRRIRLHQRISAVEPRGDGLRIRLECTVEIEGAAKPACVAERLFIAY